MPVAYSYLRFSDKKQEGGDSTRRQVEAREKWLAEHPGVILDSTLKMTDAGRSGFRRKDWDTYALAEFVAYVKSGRVEPGSYLLVENLDRLSRENVGDATELFLSIVNKGIILVQLSPVVMPFRRPIEMMPLMQAILELSRGHSESAMKSERVSAAWANKRKNAPTTPMGGRVPGWIRHKDGKLVLDPAGAKTVRRMFQLARDGLGCHAIAEKFNEDRVPVLGRKVYKGKSVSWSTPTVYHILTSRATIGEHQPKNISGKDAGELLTNYYPAVIDADKFHAVGGVLKSRATNGRGRRGKHVNMFAGLLVDARDGGSISYTHSRRRTPALVPVAALHGRGVEWMSFAVAPFEAGILERLREVKVSEVQGDDSAERKVESLSGRLAEVESLVKQWQAKMDNPATVDLVAAKLAELNTKRRELAEQVADAQREAASPLAESWGEFRSLADLLRKDNSDEMRLKVRAALRRSISAIRCLFFGPTSHREAVVQVEFNGSQARRVFFIWHRPGSGNQRGLKRPARWGAESIHSDESPVVDLREKGIEQFYVEEFMPAYFARHPRLRRECEKLAAQSRDRRLRVARRA